MTTSAAPRRWPQREHYQRAVLNPAKCIKDTRLHGCQVEQRMFLGAMNPYPRAGNFGAVYKLSDTRRAWALKVFAQAMPDRELRFQLMSQHLRAHPSPYLVDFSFEKEGIFANDQWCPALVMEWASGTPLDRYLEDSLAKSGRLDNRALCNDWVRLVVALKQMGIAHGDYQHGNILVMPDRSLKLVDYDGMYVPSMRLASLGPCEAGLPAYQHPRRFRQFDERLDDFSALLIFLSLACVDGDLWRRYHTSDDGLVLNSADLKDPDRSALLSELTQSQDEPIRKLALILRQAAKGPAEAVPAFEQVASDAAVRRILSGQWQPSAPRKAAAVNMPAARHLPRSAAEAGLTAQEQLVMRMLCLSMDVDKTALDVSMSKEEVLAVLERTQRKVGVANANDLVKWALEFGWDRSSLGGPLFKAAAWAVRLSYYGIFYLWLPWLIFSSFVLKREYSIGWPHWFGALFAWLVIGSIVAAIVKERASRLGMDTPAPDAGTGGPA